jgi:hypothetical protein
MLNFRGMKQIPTEEYSPEKAGVGGSIPSLATLFSTTCGPSGQRFHSISFQNHGAGRFASCEKRLAGDPACRLSIRLSFGGQIRVEQSTRSEAPALPFGHEPSEAESSTCFRPAWENDRRLKIQDNGSTAAHPGAWKTSNFLQNRPLTD